MDPDNSIVRLCVAGMQAEHAGHAHEAKRLYEQAWQNSSNDFEACIAAHYLARQQPDDDARFRWNEKALERAANAGVEQVRAFWASLYLNMGHSHWTRGDSRQARKFFELASKHLGDVPDGPYKSIVTDGISNGLAKCDAKSE